ncbi:MAG: TIGR01459 family HAD-type hydrolase, partial [Pseudomonadota bacterium]
MSTEPHPEKSGLTTHWICERYEATRARLPAARFPDRSDRAERLLDLVDEFDVFVLDAFGVLNVGTTVVPGALETIERIQAAGKRAIVLTNGATLPESAIQKKFEHWGYRFPPGDIVASRRILARALERDTVPSVWGIAAPAHAMVDELPGRPLRLLDDREAYDRVDGFILLSSGDWTEARQRLLAESLRQRPRPLWVANPDLVAPRETGFSFEPGYYAHRLADQLGLEPVFFGKPFTNAFD